MVETNTERSVSDKEQQARIQAWIPIDLKNEVKAAVGRRHGDTIQAFVERSLTITMEVQTKVESACRKHNISISEFLDMAVEQCLVDLGMCESDKKQKL